jgi:hypothetical protein
MGTTILKDNLACQLRGKYNTGYGMGTTILKDNLARQLRANTIRITAWEQQF